MNGGLFLRYRKTIVFHYPINHLSIDVIDRHDTSTILSILYRSLPRGGGRLQSPDRPPPERRASEGTFFDFPKNDFHSILIDGNGTSGHGDLEKNCSHL